MVRRQEEGSKSSTPPLGLAAALRWEVFRLGGVVSFFGQTRILSIFSPVVAFYVVCREKRTVTTNACNEYHEAKLP